MLIFAEKRKSVKKMKFRIPMYDFTVTLVEVEGKEDKEAVLSIMRGLKCPQEYLDSSADYIERGCYNGGDTFYNFDLKAVCVVFYGFRSERSRQNVYSHEKRHIEDRIMQHNNVDDVESAGMLAGFLGERFYEFRKLIDKG